MKITYQPEGGSVRSWSYDPENPPWDITYGTEKATGWPWMVFTDKLSDGSSVALQALIFVLRKRDEPRLELDSVTPRWVEVEVDAEQDAAPAEQADPEPGEA